jgi:hypothetical protein
LIDQSPIAFDDVIFRDLTAAHATELAEQCLYGSGTTGQVLGVLGTPNIQSIPVSSLDVPGIARRSRTSSTWSTPPGSCRRTAS